MKFYPDVFREFAEDSGKLRTPTSRNSFRAVARQLQSKHPTWDVGRWTTADLTEFCLHNEPAPATVKHRRTVLRSVFEWAAWKGYIEQDPAAALKFTVVPGSFSKRPQHWLTERQVATVLRSFPDSVKGRRDRLITMFGFFTGVRLASIAGLTWNQFSPDLSVLELKVKNQKLTRKGVPGQLRTELAEWRAEAPAGAVAVFPSLREYGLEHREREIDWSCPLGRKGVYRAVRDAGARCGITIAPHDMRRTYAGIMEEKGYDVADIQRALDHSNLGTTSTYLDKNPLKAEKVTGGLTFEL